MTGLEKVLTRTGHQSLETRKVFLDMKKGPIELDVKSIENEQFCTNTDKFGPIEKNFHRT